MEISIKGVEYHISKALKVLRVTLKDYLPLFYFLLILSLTDGDTDVLRTEMILYFLIFF